MEAGTAVAVMEAGTAVAVMAVAWAAVKVAVRVEEMGEVRAAVATEAVMAVAVKVGG